MIDSYKLLKNHEKFNTTTFHGFDIILTICKIISTSEN